MRITIINNERNEKRYSREELDQFVTRLKDGIYRQRYASDYMKDVCFAAEWQKMNVQTLTKAIDQKRKQMLAAAKATDFEMAAFLRDEMLEMQNRLQAIGG